MAGSAVGTAGAVAGVGRGAVGTTADDFIEVARTVRFEPGESAFVTELEYDLPPQLTRLEMTVRSLSRDGASLRRSESFERESETEFNWEGDSSPTLAVAVEMRGQNYREGDFPGYVTTTADGATEALGPQVVPDHQWSWEGNPDVVDTRVDTTFDGDGFAGTYFAFAGPHRVETRDLQTGPQSVVVSERVAHTPDVEDILDGFGVGSRILEPRLTVSGTNAFVLPETNWDRGPPANVLYQDVALFGEEATAVDGISNVPMHEYVHTLYGVFGTGDVYWLKEGTAEYFGYLVSVHAGVGSFGEFRSTLETEEHADIVLADIGPDSATNADYLKGAHVLGALDTEIRERSGGERTLTSVLGTADPDLTTYDGFVEAVVTATDDSTADWLDRYVRSAALPSLPRDRDRYALGPYDGEDLDRPTPTPTETPTPTPTETPTPTPTRTPGDTVTPTSPGGATVTRPSEGDAPGFGLAAGLAAVLGAAGLVELLDDGDV